MVETLETGQQGAFKRRGKNKNYDFSVYNVVMHEWCRLASVNSIYYVYL